MLYCQFSDVQVKATDAKWICERCSIANEDLVTKSPAEMLAHLKKHVFLRHDVPQSVLGSLTMEI